MANRGPEPESIHEQYSTDYLAKRAAGEKMAPAIKAAPFGGVGAVSQPPVTPSFPAKEELIIWNKDNANEVAVAKKSFTNLHDKGYYAYVVNLDGTPGDRVYSFDSSKGGKVIMTPPVPDIVTDVFDAQMFPKEHLSWNKNVSSEVVKAKSLYDELTVKHYVAYRVNADGSKGTRVNAFDANYEKLFLEHEK